MLHKTSQDVNNMEYILNIFMYFVDQINESFITKQKHTYIYP